MMRRSKTSSIVRRLLWAALVLPAAGTASPAGAQQVEVRPEVKSLYADQVLNVDVLVTGATDIAVVTPLSGADFEIVAATGNPIRDDQRTAMVDETAQRVHGFVYRFSARPLRSGALHLPSFEVRVGERVQRTQPMKIAVSAETTDSLLICEVASPFGTVYVGQPLELKLQVWIRVDQQPDFVNNLGRFLWDAQFRDDAATRLGIFSGVDLMQVRYRQNVSRSRDTTHRYHLFELRKTVYPNEPGLLDWGDIVFAYNYPMALSRDPFGGLRVGPSPLRLRRTPDVPAVNIQPLPTQGRPAEFRGAIGEYQIGTVATPSELIVGDPIKLTIEVSGRGLERLRPPDLTLNETLLRDFEVTPEDPPGEIYGSQKLFERTIRPRRLDVERVPPLVFCFFNPRTGQYKTTQSEPIPILVKPRPRLQDAATAEEATSEEHDRKPKLNPIETDALLVLQGAPPRVRWEAWLGLLPMPLVCAGILWRKRRNASASSRQAQCRRRDALDAAIRLCAKGEAVAAAEIKRLAMAYIAACAERPHINDRREAIEMLAAINIPQANIEVVSRTLVRLDEVAYSGERVHGQQGSTGDLADMVRTSLIAIDSELRG